MVALTGLIGANGLHALDRMRAERAGREAARGVAADLRAVAQEARRTRRTLAVEFDLRGRALWRVVVDGNGNGVTAADILAGLDIARPWTMVVREGRATLDVPRDLPAADGAGVIAAGSDPVVLGAAPRLTFTARGTATSASIYVVGASGAIYVVRVLGTTQRVRLSCLGAGDAWEVC